MKPVLLATEPPDVRSYAAAQATSPHETTANQWFDEAQTESCRAPGRYRVDEISEGGTAGSLPEWARHLAGSYRGAPSQV